MLDLAYWLNRATVHISSHLHIQWQHVGIWTPAMGYVHNSQHYKPGFFWGESWSLRIAVANLSYVTDHRLATTALEYHWVGR